MNQKSFFPHAGFLCKDRGDVHQNPRYDHRPKGKCRNCDQFS